MKRFKNSKRYLAFALTFLMPIYPNFELLAEQNKEKIEVSENIKNKEEAKKEIKQLIELIIKSEDKKNYDLAILYLKKAIKIEKLFFGEYHPDVGDSYTWIGRIYLSKEDYINAEKNLLKGLEIRRKYYKEKSSDLNESYYFIGKLF